MAATGGTLCIRSKRLPRDFASVVDLVRDPSARVQIVICADRRDENDVLLAASAPIQVPSLRARAGELPRIVEEYAEDTISALSATVPFTSTDRDWICARCASSLHAIETATMRLIALRQAGNVAKAAELLGMTHGALGEWLARRRPRGRRGHRQLPSCDLISPRQKRERVTSPTARDSQAEPPWTQVVMIRRVGDTVRYIVPADGQAGEGPSRTGGDDLG
jgi:hypothetical protein